MNIIDLVIILTIGISIFIGYKRGFLISAFSLGSIFLSIFFGFVLRKPLISIINKTSLPSKISLGVEKKIVNFNEGVEGSLKLPATFENLLSKFKGDILSGAQDAVVQKITSLIVTIAAILITIIIILILLFIFKKTLLAARKLPVIKQLDKLGGIALGLVQAFVALSLGFLVIYLFSSSEKLQGIVVLVEKSKLSPIFFEKNILLVLISKMKIFS